ncbi:DNA-binding protein [Pseudomonas helleri]|uniref:DNA-binding protein n=1 Tax=Pseudomonas helleri TaxID=1608996 RepID=UPI001297FF19|nr:DNA-binding protein [Pseudomonas helleri]MQT98134.1 capsule polysaccharide export protein [Pseudomonas helleri]
MALVTFESVAEAAQSLLDEGSKASVRAVIAKLGGGSPNAVLPLLNEWKAGRPRVTAADIALDPRIAGLIAEQISTASAQAAKTAEEKAADVLADAEAVAEAGRLAESKAAELELALDAAKAEILTKSRALEDLATERTRDATDAQEKISTLQAQIAGERQRADLAVQTVAKDEVRLQAIPKLEAEVQRLAHVDQKAAVLEAKLIDAQALIEDLRQRLATSEKSAAEAREATAKAGREAEKAHIGEQTALSRLESAQHEMESTRTLLAEAKAEVREARTEVKQAREEAKEARDEAKGLHAKLAEKFSQKPNDKA